jgi:biopolymer transport protein ExbB
MTRPAIFPSPSSTFKNLILATAVVAVICPAGWCAETPGQAPPAAAVPAAPAVTEKAPEHDKTLWETIKEGGVIMIPLGLTSLVMLALIIDAFMRLQNTKLAPPALAERLRTTFRHGDYEAAYRACKEDGSALANVVRAGLAMLGHGKEATESAMGDALAKEITGLHTRIRYLSVIGVVSPMLGLTGTVLGMISAFSTLGRSGIGDPSALAAAIGEVLVATATGLFVAIPGFAFYYYFGNRITATTAYTEDVINSLFRGMPYALLAGVQIGDDPIYAAAPNLQVKRIGGALQAGEQVPCPRCTHPITIGAPSCPNCHSPVKWAEAEA